MDEELRRFKRVHAVAPPIRGPPIDVDLWPELKGWDGLPISTKKNERRE